MFEPLLIINVAGLSHDAVGSDTPRLLELSNRGRRVAVQPTAPALTSTSQATILTGSPPSKHGIVANGWYFRQLALILNWQRSANLMHGETLWDTARQIDNNLKTANLFWRYATHANCDLKITERPTYWADGRKSEDTYSVPTETRKELTEKLGQFPLFRFWGPVANIESTQWIVNATIHVIKKNEFGMVLTYLPHLDYDHQRFGPNSPEGQKALRDLDTEVGRLIDCADEHQLRIAIVSDYAFERVSRPVYLNRILREAGFISVHPAENGELLEPGASQAFAVCDQQIAHVYINDEAEAARIEQLLRNTPGVGQVFDRQQMRELGICHERSGELFLVAENDCWFAYSYWMDDANQPDFAKCVAIHDKPGFDPTELFMRPGMSGKLHVAKRFAQKTLGIRAPFDVISADAEMVRGSHGRIPVNNQNRPIFVSSWQHEESDFVPMESIKDMLISGR